MRLRTKLIIWGSAAAVLAIGLGAVWLFRTPIANYAAPRVLNFVGIEGELRVTDVRFTSAVIEDLRIGPAEAPGVTARRVEASYSPLALVIGRIGGVRAEELRVRAVLDGASVSIPGLPSGGGGSREPRAPQMRIEAPDARVVLETVAGEITIDASVAGGPEEGWRASASVTPGGIERDGASLQIVSGSIEATIEGGDAEARLILEIADLIAPNASAQRAVIEASFEGAAESSVRLRSIAGRGEARLTLDGAGVDEATAEQWAAALTPALPEAARDLLEPHMLAVRDLMAGSARSFDATLAAQLLVLDGRVQLVFEGPNRIATASGVQLIMSPADEFAAIEFDRSEQRIAATGLSIALSGGGAPTAEITVAEALHEGVRGGDRISFVGAGRITPWRVDGLALGVDMRAARLDVSDDTITFVGVGTARIDGERAGYTADDAELDFDLTAELSEERIAITLAETALFELTADRLGLGELLARDVAVQLRPSPAGGPLIDINGADMVIDGRIENSQATIDVEGGRVTLELPAALSRLEALGGARPSVSLVAQGPRVSGSTSQTGALSASARIIEGDLELGETTDIDVRISTLRFAGASLPLAIDELDGEFVSTFADGAPRNGRFTIARAILCEPRAQGPRGRADSEPCDATPRLAPLILETTARIEEGVVRGSAEAAFARASGAALANASELARADYEFDLGARNGQARLVTERIAFSPARNGLQPQTLVPALRGLIAESRGSVRADATARWRGDEFEIGATVTVENLDFQTSVGSVEGVNTTFVFADVLDLRSDGPQELSVRLIDPGVPLEHGRFVIDLRGGGRVFVEEARFPFAGGALMLDPMEWIAGGADQHGLLVAREIDLGALVALTETPGLSVSGIISGRLPLVIGENSVEIDDATLQALAPGSIRYTGAAQEALSGAGSNQATQIAFGALRQFNYEELAVSLSGNIAGTMTLTVRARGSSPALDPPFRDRPITLNVPITGAFAELLRNASTSLNVTETIRRGATEGENR